MEDVSWSSAALLRISTAYVKAIHLIVFSGRMTSLRKTANGTLFPFARGLPTRPLASACAAVGKPQKTCLITPNQERFLKRRILALPTLWRRNHPRPALLPQVRAGAAYASQPTSGSDDSAARWGKRVKALRGRTMPPICRHCRYHRFLGETPTQPVINTNAESAARAWAQPLGLVYAALAAGGRRQHLWQLSGHSCPDAASGAAPAAPVPLTLPLRALAPPRLPPARRRCRPLAQATGIPKARRLWMSQPAGAHCGHQLVWL